MFDAEHLVLVAGIPTFVALEAEGIASHIVETDVFKKKDKGFHGFYPLHFFVVEGSGGELIDDG